MGEMSEYYADPVEGYLEEDRLIKEEEDQLKRKNQVKPITEIVLMGYDSNGILKVNKKLTLNDEQVSYFKAVSRAEPKLLLLKEDVEEVSGPYNNQLTYYIEFK